MARTKARTTAGRQSTNRKATRDRRGRWYPVGPDVTYAVPQMIHDARTAAGLTHEELADLAGTKPSVIARLEDPSCKRHSLKMLIRIAVALEKRLAFRFARVRRTV